MWATTPAETIEFEEQDRAEQALHAEAISCQAETETAVHEAETRSFSDEERKILLRIASAEAEGEDTEGKALVMLTVLNRVADEEFPDTVKGVVFQHGQFSPVRDNGRYWDAVPDDDCYAALSAVVSGWDGSEGALYFENPHGQEDTWHSRNLERLFRHGNHVFYK